MAKRNFVFIILSYYFLFYSVVVYAQDKNSIEITPFYGVKFFSADSMLNGSSWGIETSYRINMVNNKADWVTLLHIDYIDISASYRNQQNIYLNHNPNSKGFLGDYYGLVSKVDFNLASVGHTRILLAPGFGLGYSSQTFYTNDAPLVGSHINFTAQIGLKVLTPLSRSLRIVGTVDLYHYSNAAFKLPNYGINSINASVGIDGDISENAPAVPRLSLQNINKHRFEFGINIGRRGLVQEGGGLSGVAALQQKAATSQLYHSGLYIGYNYRFNPILSLRAGLDAVYYYKTLDLDRFYSTYEELGSSYDKMRVGGSLGTEFWLGKFSFPLNVGYYIHYRSFAPTNSHNYYPPNYYWTFGARYYVVSWMAIEAKQYLHRTQADFAGFGLVFELNAYKKISH